MNELIIPIHHKIVILRGKQIMLDSDLAELDEVATSSLEEHGGRRYMPYAFTENAVYMLSAVLKSQVAIDVSIEIMRTFAKLREFSLHYNALGKKLIELERRNDKQFKKVFGILDGLVNDTQKTDEKVMGFIKDA